MGNRTSGGKRTYGTGGLTQIGPDRWRLQGTQTGDGRRLRFSRIFRGTRKAAERELSRLLAAPPTVREEPTTVDGIVEAFIARPGLAVTTVAEYRTCHARFISPAFGKLNAADVTPSMIESLYRSMRTGGLSESRISKVHGMLSGAYKRAVRLGTVPSSPVARVDPPSQRRNDPRVPSADDVRKLRRAADELGEDVGLSVRLALVTGMRRGEVAGLRYEDVEQDPTGTVVVIRRSVAYTPAAGVVVKSTKSDRPRRIALDAETVAMIDARREREAAAGRPAERFIFGGDAPWRPDRFTATFDRVRTAAGVDVHLHGLRHHMATRAIASGVDVRTVAGRLGHANPATTLRVYSAFVPSADQAAADLLAALLDD